MATVPTPWTMGANGVIPSTSYNAGARDPLRFLLSPPLAVMRQTVVQSIPNGAFTAVTFDVHDVDHDVGHSTTTNISRYTAQTAGWYHCDGVVAWAPNATGRRLVRWTVNGVAVNASRVDLPPVGNVNQTATPAASRSIYLGVGDYLEIGGLQDSGGALSTASAADIASYMSVRWVSSI